jgi:peptidoglycan/LPS O-acetylase OafA/YrhL
MVRKLGFALVAAAMALGTVSAQAQGPRDRTTLTVVGAGVGAGMSAAYWSMNGWKWKWDSARAGITQAGAWGLTTMGCAALSPIVATAVLNRPLSYREAHILIGGCVVPIIGGWLVDQAYENHILWAPDEPQPAAVRVSRKRVVHR